jgi:hypothetical protein
VIFRKTNFMNTKKKSKTATYLLWFFGLAMLGGIGAMSAGFVPQDASGTSIKTEQEKQETTDLTSAINFAKVIRASQKDPDSFKLHSIGLTPKGTACLEYSGTNSYGARIRNSSLLTRDQKIALTTSDGNKFIEAWNAHCAKQPLNNKLTTANRFLTR